MWWTIWHFAIDSKPTNQTKHTICSNAKILSLSCPSTVVASYTSGMCVSCMPATSSVMLLHFSLLVRVVIISSFLVQWVGYEWIKQRRQSRKKERKNKLLHYQTSIGFRLNVLLPKFTPNSLNQTKIISLFEVHANGIILFIHTKDTTNNWSVVN